MFASGELCARFSFCSRRLHPRACGVGVLRKYVMRLGLRVLRALQKSAQHELGDSSRGKAIFLVATAVITSRWEMCFFFLHISIIWRHIASPSEKLLKEIF